MIDRRTLLVGLAATPLAAPLARAAALAGEPAAAPLVAGARLDAAGAASAAIVGLGAGDIASVALPARGHDVAVRPGGGECVFFARRPGRFAVALRPGGAAPTWFAAGPGRHFYGHGAFSADGRLLYSAENDYDGVGGVIGVRDATDGYRRIGEFASGGLGPHQLAMLSDGTALVVANGGMETHPGDPRHVMNLDTMTPSLAYLDVRSGDVLESHTLAPDLHQLSIRHLGVARGDTVVFGCQYQGPIADLPPLAGFHRRGAVPRLVEGDEVTLAAMRNYVGTVAVDVAGEVAAMSAPRGGLVAYWDVAARRLIGTTRLTDACGVAPLAAGFVVSSGTGALKEVSSRGEMTADVTEDDGLGWDNHLGALF